MIYEYLNQAKLRIYLIINNDIYYKFVYLQIADTLTITTKFRQRKSTIRCCSVTSTKDFCTSVRSRSTSKARSKTSQRSLMSEYCIYFKTVHIAQSFVNHF